MDVSGQGAISWRLSVLMWWGNLSAGAGAELLKYFYRSRSQSRGKSSVYPETYFDRNITTPTDQQTLQHLRSQGRKPPVTSTMHYGPALGDWWSQGCPTVGILACYTSKLPAFYTLQISVYYWWHLNDAKMLQWFHIFDPFQIEYDHFWHTPRRVKSERFSHIRHRIEN